MLELWLKFWKWTNQEAILKCSKGFKMNVWKWIYQLCHFKTTEWIWISFGKLWIDKSVYFGSLSENIAYKCNIYTSGLFCIQGCPYNCFWLTGTRWLGYENVGRTRWLGYKNVGRHSGSSTKKNRFSGSLSICTNVCYIIYLLLRKFERSLVLT